MIKIYHIDEAVDRVMMGPAKKSRALSKRERDFIAHHEAGHAVLGIKLDNANIVHKVTIIPRGNAGGYALMLPEEEESFLATRKSLVDQITGLSPVISIEQKTTNRNPRSTVGTITEIYDFLRLLYARVGVAYSYNTDEKMVSYSDEEIHELIMNDFKDFKKFCEVYIEFVKKYFNEAIVIKAEQEIAEAIN